MYLQRHAGVQTVAYSAGQVNKDGGSVVHLSAAASPISVQYFNIIRTVVDFDFLISYIRIQRLQESNDIIGRKKISLLFATYNQLYNYYKIDNPSNDNYSK